MSTPVVATPADAEVRTFVAAALAGDTLAALQVCVDIATRDAAAPELLHMDAWLRPRQASVRMLAGTSTAPAEAPAVSPLAALDALVWPRREQPPWRPQVEELAHRLVQHADDAALRQRAIAYVQWLAQTAPDTESRAAWQSWLETLRR